MLRNHKIVLLLTTSLASSVFYLMSTPVAAQAADHTLTIGQVDNLAGQNLALTTITSSPAGINCGQTKTSCSAQFEEGTQVTLTASVEGNNPDISFRWFPVSYFHASPNFTIPYMNCAGMDSQGYITGKTCTAPMPSSDVSLKFKAAYTRSNLTVSKTGTGSGTVANQNPIKPPLLINCGQLCATDISASLILFAIPDPGSVFAGWNINGGSSSDCNPTNYSGKCLTSYQVDPRGDGKTDTFVAVFNKQSVASGSAKTKEADSLEPPTVQLRINDKISDTTDGFKIKNTDTLTLSGKSFASATIRLYLFSEPKTYTAIANKDGNWEIEIKDIASGTHRIEAQVYDATTNKTSNRKNIASFTVVQAAENKKADTSTSSTVKQNNIAIYIAVLVAAILLVLAIAIYVARIRKKKTSQVSKTSKK